MLAGIKSGLKSQNAKNFGDGIPWNPWAVEIVVDDEDDIYQARTIPELKNPEFLCGNIKHEKSREINAAIEKSGESQKMCEIWYKVASRRLQSKIPSKSDVNLVFQTELETALNWLKTKLEIALRVSEGIVKSDPKKSSQIGDEKDEKSRRIGAKNSCVWNFCSNCFCCFRAKASEFRTDESKKQIVVYVKFLCGSTLIVNQQLDGEVADIKKKIQTLKSIPPELQTLFLNGKQLNDNTRLDCIEGLSNSTITIIQRRCTLGVPADVVLRTVSSDSGENIAFSSEHFQCLYKWYVDGQAAPDIYRGEFSCGSLGTLAPCAVVLQYFIQPRVHLCLLSCRLSYNVARTYRRADADYWRDGVWRLQLLQVTVTNLTDQRSTKYKIPRIELMISVCLILRPQVTTILARDRGQWLGDQHHGFGVQWRQSGQMYCGQWVHNVQSGFGIHVDTRVPPSPYNPHLRQSLFVGAFRKGCPLSGWLVECEDYRTLTTEDFGADLVDESKSCKVDESKSCKVDAAGGRKVQGIDWKSLQERKARTYEVEYDGTSAFWQSPVPLKKAGLFDFRTRLCEHAVPKRAKKLTDPKSLEEMWYAWVPDPDAPLPASATERDQEGSNEQPDHSNAKGDQLPSQKDFTEPDFTKETTFESFRFLGKCVRNGAGRFPCPLEGKQKMLPSDTTGSLDGQDEFDVEYDGRVWIVDGPAPTAFRARREYLIPEGERSHMQTTFVIPENLIPVDDSGTSLPFRSREFKARKAR